MRSSKGVVTKITCFMLVYLLDLLKSYWLKGIGNKEVSDMANIEIDAPGTSHLFIGNEAIARGALEAGVGFAAAYPGTPSSEILGSLAQIAKKMGIYAERSEEHTSELQSHLNLVCRLLLEK